MSSTAPMSNARGFGAAAVIGGSGFIGRHVVEHLVSRDVSVTSIDRRPSDVFSGSLVQAGVAPTGEITACLQATTSRERLDLVVVATGTGLVPRSFDDPHRDLSSNADPLLSALEFARRQDRPPVVVNISSAAVYGNAVHLPITETHPLAPRSPYGVSKLAGEEYARLYQRLFGVPSLSVRPFSVFGPGQRKLVIFDLATRILNHEDPLIISAPAELTRDFVHVSDVAEEIVRLAEHSPADAQSYNLCSGHATSLNGLAELLVSALGADTQISFTGSVRPGDPLHWVGSREKTERQTGLTPVDLDAGLRQTLAWIQADRTAET